MKRIMLYLFLVLHLSCDHNVDLNTLDYSLFGEGELFGNGAEGIEESEIIIRDAASWNELKARMDSYNQTSHYFDTEIDFETEMLLAIFDQIRPKTHYSFQIRSILEYPNELVVDYKQTGTIDGYTVMNQPFLIIKIQRTGKEIRFE